ncbi:hypothetical protein SAMN04489806_1120 [Paramicrobacterium humi]|uniref:Uncharacterized protein n=1 Tax=Paramicrobacterium humi TaxID=640635 RepID=A0A1H4KET4_9MICO|nr:hypothetical protein [Microbacterium humi]SEB56452.1 hypothetical protein SAMN04489806_1120 [Microbacterium humi]
MDRGIDTFLTRTRPISLSNEELDLKNNPVRRPSAPIPVRAWVRFFEATVRPDAEAIAWTDKAVQALGDTARGDAHGMGVGVSS